MRFSFFPTVACNSNKMLKKFWTVHVFKRYCFPSPHTWHTKRKQVCKPGDGFPYYYLVYTNLTKVDCETKLTTYINPRLISEGIHHYEGITQAASTAHVMSRTGQGSLLWLFCTSLVWRGHRRSNPPPPAPEADALPHIYPEAAVSMN